MKSDLKAKYLQYLNTKKQDEGFTLIELLVVIIIIGILSAIALPSFLNQAAKAKQTEAKTYVGSVNRAQQAYRIANPAFGSSVESLEIGIPTLTTEYTYTIAQDSIESTEFTATPADVASLRGYAGGVLILNSGQTEAVACQNSAVFNQDGSALPSINLSTTTPTAADVRCGSAENVMD